MHVAKDFNIVFVYTDVLFLENQIIPPNMAIHLMNEYGRMKYKTALDLTQFHIPFRTYNEIKEDSSAYNLTLHIFPYDLTKYAMFGQFGNP